MVTIMPSSGSVASRLASPKMSKVEHPSSKQVAIVAAASGGIPGSLYSSVKSAGVVSQTRAFWRPARRKTTRDGESEQELVQGEGEVPEERADRPPPATEAGGGKHGFHGRLCLPVHVYVPSPA